MKRSKVSILGWAVVGALVAAVVVAGLRIYIIVTNGYSLAEVPVTRLIFEVMELHKVVLYGALGGSLLGLVEMLYRYIRYREWGTRSVPSYEEEDNPDQLIKAERARRAELYLASKGINEPLAELSGGVAPHIENFITARNGQLTYCVKAYRQLSQEEMVEVVREALAEGRISEPEPGGTTVLLTEFGKFPG